MTFSFQLNETITFSTTFFQHDNKFQAQQEENMVLKMLGTFIQFATKFESSVTPHSPTAVKRRQIDLMDGPRVVFHNDGYSEIRGSKSS